MYGYKDIQFRVTYDIDIIIKATKYILVTGWNAVHNLCLIFYVLSVRKL